MLIDSFCQAYHWTLDDAVKLTMPQVILLNHAAWVNRENAERRSAAKNKNKKFYSDDPVVESERNKVSSMNPQQLSVYLTQAFE